MAYWKLAACQYNTELSLAGVRRVLQHPRKLGVLLTLFQPEGADYVYHITASTPGFEILTTSLNYVYLCLSLLISFFPLQELVHIILALWLFTSCVNADEETYSRDKKSCKYKKQYAAISQIIFFLSIFQCLFSKL